jgi:RsiW-degrading membrane proteinase PrsW (M82 family)
MHCDHCGRDVPEGVFCTNCGAHQGGETHPNPKSRHTHYAAHPGEHVFQPGVFTTIFPHLGARKVHEFRWVFIGVVVGIFILFFAGLITAAICVSILGLPFLYLLYLYEAQVYKEEPLPVLGLLVVGAIGLGILVTWGTDHLITTQDKFSVSVTGGSLIVIGVLIPLIQEAAKPFPALLLRFRPAFRDETMDGLVFGIAAGLGFGVGESFVRFSNVLTNLPVHTTPSNWIYPLLTTAILLPLMQGTATGLICAALWRFALGRGDALAMLAIITALGGHILFSTITQVFINHGWSQVIIIAWQALVVVVLIVVMRILLHTALVEEAKTLTPAERFCAHCHKTVLAEGFCPSCGGALTAVPYHTRPSETTATSTPPPPPPAVNPAPAGGAA